MNRTSLPDSRASIGRRRRAAFACTLAIMVTGVLMIFVIVLGRYAVSEIGGLQAELLSAQADQILLSARDWSNAHDERLRTAGAVELPLDTLLPGSANGQLELRRMAESDEPPLIECHLKITRGRRSVSRHVFWPVRDSE